MIYIYCVNIHITIFVVFPRVNLWNLIDIVRAVDRQPRMFNLNYKSSYLKLPLLKFEMLDMKAAVPEFYQEDR